MDWSEHVPAKIGKLSQREILWLWGEVERIGRPLDPKYVYPKELAVKHILPFMTAVFFKTVGTDFSV